MGQDAGQADNRQATPAAAPSPDAVARFLEQAHDFLGRHDADGRWIYASPSAERITGHAPNALVGRLPFDFVDPDDRDALERYVAAAATGIEQPPVHYRFHRADGTVGWFETSISRTIDLNGDVAELHSITRNITPRVRLQTELERRTRDLSEAQRQARLGSWYWDRASNQLHWSEELFLLLGRTAAAGQPTVAEARAGYTTDALARLDAAIARTIRTGDPYQLDLPHTTPSGQVWFNERGEAVRDDDGAIVGLRGTVLDVTARVEVEQALRANERRYWLQGRFNDLMIRVLTRFGTCSPEEVDAAVLDALADLARFFDVNHALVLLYTPDHASCTVGYEWRAPGTPQSEADAGGGLLGVNPAYLIEHLDRDRAVAFESGADIPPAAINPACPPSTPFSGGQLYVPLKGREGAVLGALALYWHGSPRSWTRDDELRTRILGNAMAALLERKRADADMRLKDQAIESSLNGVVVVNAAGAIVYVNPAFVRMMRCTDGTPLLGKMPLDFATSATEAERILERLISGESFSGELGLRRPDGTTFESTVWATSLRDHSGALVALVGTFIDLSESKSMQAQLMQSQKMETIGRLAGGVAHDFNNLLTVIKGYLEMALDDVPEHEHAMKAALTTAEQAANSAAKLTQQLLAFSRKQVINPTVIDLNQAIDRVQHMLRRLIGEQIRLMTLQKAALWSVWFDPTQCDQILINLAVNARDAMPEGGTLALETTHLRVGTAGRGSPARLHPPLEPGDYVVLSVADTGTGMPPEVLAHIFEPFFTTKGPGRGTGLGLAMVYGAVTQNGGRIDVDSGVGHGTTVRVYLPRVTDQQRHTPATATPPTQGGNESLVVVEDELSVRSLAVAMLTRLGYEVMAFEDGAQALAACERFGTHVDLLITDVVLPGISGRELAKRLAATRPGLKVLFTSGYTPETIAQQGLLDPNVPFMPKPFSRDVLARRVREILDAACP